MYAQTQNKTKRHTDKEIKLNQTQTNKQTNKLVNKQTYIQTIKLISKQTTNKQTN